MSVPFEISLETSQDCKNWTPIWKFPPSPQQPASLSLRQALGHMHVHILRPDGLLTFPLLDPSTPHLEFWVKGDVRSEPQNLAAPHDIAIVMLEDMDIADNFRDLVVSINPIEHDGKPEFVAGIWAEGAYEKWLCYDDKLIHHYQADDRLSYHGDFATYDLPLKGKCPFQ